MNWKHGFMPEFQRRMNVRKNKQERFLTLLNQFTHPF